MCYNCPNGTLFLIIPCVTEKDKPVRFSLILPPPLRAAIADAAERDRRSVNAEIVVAIERFLKESQEQGSKHDES